MGKIIDITSILTKNKENEWVKKVFHLSTYAKTEEERLYWTEQKLAYQFDCYYKQTGKYHPKDPAGMDDNDGHFVKI
jgi:hypothetical protein